MIREWDVLTSTRKYKPTSFWLMYYDNVKLVAGREQVLKQLDIMLEKDEISFDTHTQLTQSMRGL